MRHLRPYMKKYRMESILAPAFKMLEAAFDLTVPLLVARIIDQGVATGNTRVIWSNFALMLLMALLGLACSSLRPRLPSAPRPVCGGICWSISRA